MKTFSLYYQVYSVTEECEFKTILPVNSTIILLIKDSFLALHNFQKCNTYLS